MRILAWNTGWNVSAGVVKMQTEAVARLDADVAFFSEWSPLRDRVTGAGTVRSSSGHLRADELAEAGLPYQCYEHVSERAGDGRAWSGAYWGVLAAATSPIHKTLLTPPLHAPGSWLELTHERSGLTLVGVRLPAWDGKDTYLRRELWLWMVEQFDRLATVPTVVLGDFNTESEYGSSAREVQFGGDLLRSVTRERGWRDPYVATGTAPEPTFWHRSSARRIDHAMVSPAFQGSIDAIHAPTQVEHLVVSGPARDENGEPRRRLADHAPLVIDVTPVRDDVPSEASTAAEADGYIGSGMMAVDPTPSRHV